MRNLFLFVWKNHFTVLFVLLEVLGFWILISGSNFHQSQLHQSGVTIAGSIYNLQYSYRQYLGLSDENEKLRNENALLLREKINHRKGVSLNTNRYKTIPTQAIESTYHLKNNYILINSGLSHGIEPASAVIGPEGIVGIIHSVGKNYASVLPLLHSNSNINAKLLKSSYFGQCKWRGIDEQFITLENIPNHVVIEIGDSIVSRGAGGIFPPDILIGTASSFEKDESSGFQEVQIKLATDFRKINTLYVIVNEERDELDSLQIETEKWTD